MKRNSLAVLLLSDFVLPIMAKDGSEMERQSDFTVTPANLHGRTGSASGV